MRKTLHHVGIAVRSLEQALQYWRDGLGLRVSEIREVESEGVRIAFLDTGQCRVELLEPISESSPIARFLEKRGEGIHHLCFDDPDLGASLAGLKRSGAQLLDQEPRSLGGGREGAFVHPRSGNGVLVELYGKAGEA